jgi:hypothetical protein
MALQPCDVSKRARDKRTINLCEEEIDRQIADHRDGEANYLHDAKTGAIRVTVDDVGRLNKQVIEAVIDLYTLAGWMVTHSTRQIQLWTDGDEKHKKFTPHTEDYFILTPPQPKRLKEARIKEPPKPKNPRRGFVYLFKCNGHYKIGRSKDPSKRMQTMAQAIMPFKITRIHTIPCKDAVVAERELHLRYATKRVKGEWFNLSIADVRTIKAIQCL